MLTLALLLIVAGGTKIAIQWIHDASDATFRAQWEQFLRDLKEQDEP